MKIEFISNASILITTGSGRTILCDPWFSDGAYYGSWYNFPPLSETGRRRYTGLEPNFIYISHLHPDHLDAETLSEYPKSTPILVGQLPHHHLTRAIEKLGFSDIRQLPLETACRIDGFDISIYGEFSSTSANIPNYVDYAMNTALLLRDTDGTQLFHSVDNVMQPEHSRQIAARHGKVHVALLPYAGASLYPYAFPAYSDSKKQRQQDDLTRRMLDLFLADAEALGAAVTIPSAGSFVMGGALTSYNRWLSQAPPAAIRATWEAAGRSLGALAVLSEGDILDVASGEIIPNRDAPFRNFAVEDRNAYGATLADRALLHEKVLIPPGFDLPWRRLLVKARRNLLNEQRRLGVYPNKDIRLLVLSPKNSVVEDFSFALEGEEPYAAGQFKPGDGGRSWVAFRIDARLLAMILLSAAVWNNAEIGALVEVEREPDEYDPTIHSLMSFFVL